MCQGKDVLSQPITIYVSRASREAIQSIEEKGGKVTTVYYNKLGIKYLLDPAKFGTTRRPPRAALPVRRYLIGNGAEILSN
jgi:large subunit ribosomal protein L15